MAIVSMDKIHIFAMKRDRKRILELLQRRGIVDISDNDYTDEVFEKSDTSSAQALFKRNADNAEQALTILGKLRDDKKPITAFLRMQQSVSVEENDRFVEKRDEVLKTVGQVLALDRRISEANTEILRLETMKHSLEPWMSLPVPLNFSGTKKTAFFVGSLDGEHSIGDIGERLVAFSPELDKIHIELVFAEKALTCFFVIVPLGLKSVADEALRSIGFTRPASPGGLIPREEISRLDELIANERKAIDSSAAALKGLTVHYDDISYLEDYMTMREEKYRVLETLSQSRHTFILEGYIPSLASDGLKKELTERFCCDVETEAPGEKDDVPVGLKNNWFSEPMETVLESYSSPAKGELDPSNVMSIFYFFMFGMMFSDAAYGLIMVLVCGGLLLTVKNIKPNWKNHLKMFFWCGVSTVFWGVMFSSYFGDVVDSIGRTFFDVTITIPPLWFAPLDDPMKLLIFCMAIGIIHLTTGYVLNGITSFKNKRYSAILYDAVFPVTAMFPLIYILLGTELFEGIGGFRLEISTAVTYICVAISAISIVGIVFTSGRESKNWGKRILKGIYGVYNVLSGWLSDVLSYSRLLALGLATGIIATVFNQLGEMAGGGFDGIVGAIIGFIIYLAVFVVGHTLNFGINVLGAYVHSNRLQYVEFFGKFYEGGGRKYLPYGMHTKHYIIREEIKNV